MAPTETTEERICKLLQLRDPTGLQLAMPLLLLEKWEPPALIAALKACPLGKPNNIMARATALCAAGRTLIDVAPTWGMWERPDTKRKIKKMLAALKKFDQTMGEDEWQGPEPEGTEEEVYTDVFLESCGWKTHWPLCDFLREIEVHKQHKFN